MQGGLTSPSQRWFRLGLENQELSRYKPVRMWLDAVETIMLAHFRKSNFYRNTISVYKEVSCFGSSCLFEEEHSSGQGIWFHLITAGDFVFAPNPQGRIDTVYRRDWMTADQMEGRFGKEALSNDVQKVLDKSPYTYFEIIHCVRPRKDRDPEKLDALNMPFESVYWEKGKKDGVLSESGFTENPYMTPRWFTSGSLVYGVGPGIDGMPTIRGSNTIKDDLFRAVNKEVDPPLAIPSSLWGNVDADPGGETPVEGGEKIQELYQISPNLSAGDALSQQEKQSIRDWFFVNLFLLTTNPNATATEVAKKAQEQLIQLGPVLQGLFDEFLTPVIDRSFSILFKQGLIPIPPPELEGQDLEIEYISTLAQAQKQVSVESNAKFAFSVMEMASIVPGVLDNVDWDEMVRSNAANIGVQAKLLRSAEEVAQSREIQQKVQQMQGAQDAMEQSSRTAMNLSNTKLDEDNAAARMAEQQEG